MMNHTDRIKGAASHPFDFHLHSDVSDGTDTPEALVRRALDVGMRLIALTDHDTVGGVKRARAEGKKAGVTVLSGIELDVEHPCELHIIGLGVDADNQALGAMLQAGVLYRLYRNERILNKLEALGVDIKQHLAQILAARGDVPDAPAKSAIVTRLHIAQALVRCGTASSIDEAFARYLEKGGAAYVSDEKTDKRRAIDVIHEAGGMAVLAHPCKLKCEPFALIRELKGYGLDALEAYYPSTTPGQLAAFVSIAEQLGLHLSSGSDYHGENRKSVTIGCAYEDVPALREFGRALLDRVLARDEKGVL